MTFRKGVSASATTRRQRPPRRVKTPTILQMEASECGAAALAIVLAYYGKYVPLEVLRVDCGISRLGSNANNIVKAARKYDLDSHAYHKKLESLSALSAPYIVYWNFNHFVVVEGIRGDQYFLNDPAYGPRRLTTAEFSRSFSGIVLTAVPAANFAKGGTPARPLISLLERLRGSHSGLAWIILVSMAIALLGIAIPSFLRVFVDDIVIKGLPILPALILVMGIVAILSVVFGWLQQTFLIRLETKLSVISSSQFLRHLLRLPTSFFDGRFAGELGERLASNDRIARTVAGELTTAFLSSILVLFYIGLMLQFDVLMTVIGVGVALLNSLTLRYFARQRRDATQRLLSETGKLVGNAMNGLRAIESLKVSGAEPDFFVRLAGFHANMIDSEQELGIASQFTLVLPPLLLALNAALVLAIGGLRVIDGHLSVGMLVAFQWLMISFLTPVTQLVRLGTQSQQLEGDLRRVDDVLRYPIAEPVQPVSSTDAPPLSQLSGDLAVQSLVFGYSPLEKPLFDQLKLSIKAGTFVGIVGSVGSGKTTLAKLLVGLYSPWDGMILFDQHPLHAISPEVLRRDIAFVDQSGLLFEGTIRDNLTLWDTTVSNDQIIRAAQDACIHEEVQRRQAGYDHLVEEQGRNFSGGQRQQLDIARALIHDPAILILDEATSALDAVVEREILANLRRRGCVCLLITHRLSAIRDCDQIVVLAAGQIVEQGTHSALMANDGSLYAQLISVEASNDAVAPDAVSRDAVLPNIPTLPTAADSSQPITRALATDSAPNAARSLGADALRNVLRPRTAQLVALAGTAQTAPLLAALRVIGRTNRFPVSPAPMGSPDDPVGHLRAIATASRLRMRTVALRGTWWQHDNGALLAFHNADQRPLALIPASPRRYELYDVSQGQIVTLTAQIAASIQTKATMIYRPLPDGAISLLSFVRFGLSGSQRDLLVIVVTGLLNGLFQLLLPALTAVLLDTVLPQADRNLLVQITATLIGAAAAIMALTLTQNAALLRIESRMESTMQSALWDRLLRLPITFFQQFTAGDLGSRAISLSAIRGLLSNAVLNAIFSGIFSVLAIGLMFYYSGALAWLAVVLALLNAVITVVISERVLRFEREIGERQGRLSGMLLQFISGILRLQAAGAVDRAFNQWADRFSVIRRLTVQSRQYQSILNTFNMAYPLVALGCIFVVTALTLPSGNLSLGGFLAFNAAFTLLLSNIAQLSTAVVSVLQAIPMLERLRPILTANVEVLPDQSAPPQLSGRIEVDQISYRYQPYAPRVLHDVSFMVNPGEFVALIGPSGSGKSTVLRLLLGFDQPEIGQVRYNDHALGDLDIQAVRRQLGVVLQDQSIIASGHDIFHNIIDNSAMTEDQVWEAVRLVGLESTIRALPMGIRTILMGGGNPLSAGQQQQLLIARAIATQPRILLFDEATRFLDNKTQALVSQNLARLSMTRLVIAHRLNTVIHADRILVMDHGRIVQTGTYDELSKQDGLFADLIRTQRLD